MPVSRRRVLQIVPALALPAIRGARADDAPFRIGTLLSTTGPAAFLGQDMHDGALLAVEQINAGGGINGRKIDWLFRDAQSDTQRALNDTRRLLGSDQVDMIVGGGSMSGIALAMAPMCEQAGVPFIATEGAAGIVAPVADHKRTFKSTVDDDLAMQRLADFWAKKNATRIALLADTSGFGQSATEQLKAIAPTRGLQVQYESFAPGDTDMTAQLGRARDAKAQVILCWTVTPAGVVFLKQAQVLGIDPDVLLMHGYGFVANKYMELAGSSADRLLLLSQKFVVGPDLPDSDIAKKPILALETDYRARFNRAPNQFVAQTYDAIGLARVALAKGGKDRAKVRDALENITDYACASGVFTFSPQRHSGLGKQNLVIVRWGDGRFHLVDLA
jgi:branched-chain amino acid transport system substrate-binding protein